MTSNGRFVVVDGRRWRATDPGIPEGLRVELVSELMAARRAVAAARRTEDPAAERSARDRVHDAKVALGERGDPWWEPPTPSGRAQRIDATLLALARHRGPGSSICPSDAARAVGGPTWRSQMAAVRDRVRSLAGVGGLEVLQRGEVLDPDRPWDGPIRVRLAARGTSGPD